MMLLQTFAALLLLHICLADLDCFTRITSDGSKRGNFSSPSYPRNYANGLRCTIEFIGNENERVKINFTDFRIDGFSNELAGVHTGCTDDYMEIYNRIAHPDHDELDTPLLGRYCGNDLTKLPYLIMSQERKLVIGFDSNNDNKTARGFFGYYEFISNEPFKMGEAAHYTDCGWTMYASTKSQGYIMAPYYPAVYPDDLECFYKLEGTPGQRIKLEFIDFDVYYGGDHCPYDKLEVYDGNSSLAPKIGSYCNKIEGMVIYSTRHQLYLQFTTRHGRPRVEHRWGDPVIHMSGFKARYTFSDHLVNLDFITDGKHIRGSECDMRILSTGESSGEIRSPNYPQSSPSNITCFYYIDGLIDSDNLEKVQLTFETAILPPAPADINNRCNHGQAHISTYLYGQKPTDARPDSILCDLNRPPNLLSHNPRLTLKYTTRTVNPAQAVGFQANYKFAIDYAIEGTPATLPAGSDCHFIYRSDSKKQGKLNSPRYPSAYPNDITCTYELIAEPSEFIMISFDSFNVQSSGVEFGDCKDKFSAVSVIPQTDNNTLQIPMGEYCGTAYPGPLVSEWLTERMLLTFMSDSQVTESGFQAKYEFIHSKERFPCGGNLTEGGSGVIKPPNYPLKYQTRTVCDWYIYRSNPQAQIKIQFEHFDIEGTMEEGCQGAVLRIYKSNEYNVDIEACGQQAPVDHVISENGFIRVKFISSSKSFGNTGFKIHWTEVMSDKLYEHKVPANKTVYVNQTIISYEVPSCPWFQCADSVFCVPEAAVCNSRHDCFDGSDELDCVTKLSNVTILYIIMAVVIAALTIVLATICICIRCSVEKSRTRRNSSRKTSSKPSEADLPIDPEMVCSDTKTPMLPTSQSTNSTFLPYDHHQNGNRYTSPPTALSERYDPGIYDHTSGTIANKYMFSDSPLHSSLHQGKDSGKYLSGQNQYDMESCLTSL